MPKTTVNSILRDYSSEYLSAYKPDFSTQKVIRAISECRTKALGGRVQQCGRCGHEVILYNSCRNRHCPQCQSLKKEEWVEKKKEDLLPFQYFHVVFTLPAELNSLIYRNKKALYRLLFEMTAKTVQSAALEERYRELAVVLFKKILD